MVICHSLTQTFTRGYILIFNTTTNIKKWGISLSVAISFRKRQALSCHNPTTFAQTKSSGIDHGNFPSFPMTPLRAMAAIIRTGTTGPTGPPDMVQRCNGKRQSCTTAKAMPRMTASTTWQFCEFFLWPFCYILFIWEWNITTWPAQKIKGPEGTVAPSSSKMACT